MFSAALHTPMVANNSGGEQIDPREEDILAATGVLQPGSYVCMVTITASDLAFSVAQFKVHRRNAADDDDVESVVVSVPVDDSKQFETAWRIKQDEQITVTPYVDMVGTVTAALNWQRVG